MATKWLSELRRVVSNANTTHPIPLPSGERDRVKGLQHFLFNKAYRLSFHQEHHGFIKSEDHLCHQKVFFLN
jgi:hypothetical protein